MPGHLVSGSIFIDPGAKSQWEKYQCPKCDLLLREAVQPSCGHWLCETCAEELFQAAIGGSGPYCPRKDCGEELNGEDGANYFPDRFVRRDILAYIVRCLYHENGCSWQGKFSEYEIHVTKECRFARSPCQYCGELQSGTEALKSHEATCTKAGHVCPFHGLGCQDDTLMLKDELTEHLGSKEGVATHLIIVAASLEQLSKQGLKRQVGVGGVTRLYNTDSHRLDDMIETDRATSKTAVRVSVETDGHEPSEPGACRDVVHFEPQRKLQYEVAVNADVERFEASGSSNPTEAVSVQKSIQKVHEEVKSLVHGQLQKQEREIVALQSSVAKLERQLRTKTTELEERDFRLSLIENSSYDGTIVWKIPQFEQRMTDARTGKYTSIFSLPFYTDRFGYKMCLRLYILGDGIGKNTHMSLFFVIMRNEFDNILPWPFTHRVTFKLINQCGGRDVVDTFQPDPASSSFKKPKSDMNIASGCPKFVAQEELKNGFIVDDTLFIKCTVDRSTIRKI